MLINIAYAAYKLVADRMLCVVCTCKTILTVSLSFYLSLIQCLSMKHRMNSICIEPMCSVHISNNITSNESYNQGMSMWCACWNNFWLLLKMLLLCWILFSIHYICIYVFLWWTTNNNKTKKRTKENSKMEFVCVIRVLCCVPRMSCAACTINEDRHTQLWEKERSTGPKTNYEKQ